MQPVSFLNRHDLNPGESIALDQFLDLKEMGAPAGLVGRVVSIAPAPAIESGPGRVVLTTVNHLNNFVFDLTVRDAKGRTDTLGVTGYHRFFDERDGWQQVIQLQVGDRLWTNRGDVTVTAISRDPGVHLVYNMTVEADHVYFVGGLATLAHNDGCYGRINLDAYKWAYQQSGGEVFPTPANTWSFRTVRGPNSAPTILERLTGAMRPRGPRYQPYKLYNGVAQLRTMQRNWIQRMSDRGRSRWEIENQMRANLIRSGWSLGQGELPRTFRRMLDATLGG